MQAAFFAGDCLFNDLNLTTIIKNQSTKFDLRNNFKTLNSNIPNFRLNFSHLILEFVSDFGFL